MKRLLGALILILSSCDPEGTVSCVESVLAEKSSRCLHENAKILRLDEKTLICRCPDKKPDQDAGTKEAGSQ